MVLNTRISVFTSLYQYISGSTSVIETNSRHPQILFRSETKYYSDILIFVLNWTYGGSPICCDKHISSSTFSIKSLLSSSSAPSPSSLPFSALTATKGWGPLKATSRIIMVGGRKNQKTTWEKKSHSQGFSLCPFTQSLDQLHNPSQQSQLCGSSFLPVAGPRGWPLCVCVCVRSSLVSQSSIIHHHIYSPIPQLIWINGANRKHEGKLQSQKNKSPAPRFSGGQLITTPPPSQLIGLHFHIRSYRLDAVADMFY